MNKPEYNTPRLAVLDYLRGLCAVGIMVYHYILWTQGDPDVSTFLARIGIYGVSIFYILSGITLYHVYVGKISEPWRIGLRNFTISRIFRIFPLLWLLTIATLVIKREDYSIQTIALNLTGLFGIFDRANTICYGAWSIGNELVFYLFFPIFMWLCRNSKLGLTVVAASILSFSLWNAYLFMDSHQPLTAQYWIPYINPLNQLILFFGGVLIAHITKSKSYRPLLLGALFLVGLATFILYPAHGNAMLLISGTNRFIFTATCFLICFAAYKTNRPLPQPLHWVFGKLGAISYSLYLVHPLTAYIYPRILKYWLHGLQLPEPWSGFSFTILVAWALYTFFELPFMRLGKKLIALNRLIQPPKEVR